MSVKAYLGLGSNLGDRRKNIERAIAYLRESAGIRVEKVSSIMETEPAGGPKQGKFLNACLEIKTDLPPADLLRRLKSIERKFGRRQSKVRWGPRTIDLDILLYGKLILKHPGLSIPHALMHERKFVLGPLAEIAPEAGHPVLKKTVKQLLRKLKSRKVESREKKEKPTKGERRGT